MEKKIWVGVMLGLEGSGMVVRAASTMKGLCELVGVSYSTAKSKKADSFVVLGGIDGSKRYWNISSTELRKVRGRKGGNPGNLVRRG